MSNIEIVSRTGNYTIEIRSKIPAILESSIVLVDSKIKTAITGSNIRMIEIEASEENKNLSTVESLILQLSKMNAKKGDSITVIGGGCVQDLGTLVSALYMRGITWDYWPSTLAAMGDSCIGGKSSINVGTTKNLVGNFYPPESIEIYVEFIETLPDIEILAGASEIVKICFVHSDKAFNKCLGILQKDNWHKDPEQLMELVELSLSCKKYFIEIDEFDVKERKLLNFGHSFGHAIESATQYKVPHGVAVLIGMIAATNHVKSATNSMTELLQQISLSLIKLFASDIHKNLLNFDISEFQKAILMDKKNGSEDLTLVLPTAQGLVLVKDLLDDGSLSRATDATNKALELVKHEIR